MKTTLQGELAIGAVASRPPGVSARAIAVQVAPEMQERLCSLVRQSSSCTMTQHHHRLQRNSAPPDATAERQPKHAVPVNRTAVRAYQHTRKHARTVCSCARIPSHRRAIPACAQAVLRPAGPRRPAVRVAAAGPRALRTPVPCYLRMPFPCARLSPAHARPPARRTHTQLVQALVKSYEYFTSGTVPDENIFFAKAKGDVNPFLLFIAL